MQQARRSAHGSLELAGALEAPSPGLWLLLHMTQLCLFWDFSQDVVMLRRMPSPAQSGFHVFSLTVFMKGNKALLIPKSTLCF